MKDFTSQQVAEIQKIVQAEMQKNLFKYPKMQRHYHNNVDSPKIPSSSIVQNIASIGKINFAETKTYTINFAAGSPSLIIFNGLAFQTGAGEDYIIINGTAIITTTLSFQPQTTSSVIVGGTPYPISNGFGPGILAQGSSNLYIAGATAFGHVDENFIVNGFSALNTPVVTGQLMNIKPSSVDLVVTNLTSGWELSGYFTIK